MATMQTRHQFRRELDFMAAILAYESGSTAPTFLELKGILIRFQSFA
jgi:hypothetical protein